MSFTEPNCFGENTGTATVTAAGGTGPYSYVWTTTGAITPVINGISQGVYDVNVTDANQCISSGTVTVTEPAQILAN